MNLNKILPIVLVILVLVSALQAFQLNNLKEKLDGGTTVAKSPTGTSTGSAVASSGNDEGGVVPNSISDLPTMVGGC